MVSLEIVEGNCIVAMRADGGSTSGFLRRIAPEAELMTFAPYTIELSDDPSSHEARRGSFGLLRDDMLHRIAVGRLVAVDGQGLREDQASNLVRLANRQCAPSVQITNLPADTSQVEVLRTRSPTNHRQDKGPFDIIGDVHGCIDELVELLELLGYRVTRLNQGGVQRWSVSHEGARRIAFVGDLADRGPDAVACLSLAMDSVQSGAAVWVMGNHDKKLLDWLSGQKTAMNHGFATTVEAVEHEPQEWRERLLATLRALPSHMLLDGGRLVIAHAGCLESMQGKDSGYLNSFCMYGAVDGSVDANGLPVRADWAAHYHGQALVVHGHTPVQSVRWGTHGNVACIDTGCCFGGQMTAMLWPERTLVAVPARYRYAVHPDLESSLEPAPTQAGPPGQGG